MNRALEFALDHPIRLRWLLLGAAAGIGVGVWSAVGDHPAREVGSYVLGLVLVIAALEFGAFNIRLAGKYAPSMTIAVAMASYFTTVVALGLAVAASSPNAVSDASMATGLFIGLTIWLGAQVAASCVHEYPEEPVNIRAQDETIPTARSGRRA